MLFFLGGGIVFYEVFFGLVSGDGKKRETVCEYHLSLVIVIYSQTFFCFVTKVAFCSAIEINFIALAYSQIFRFAQDIAFRSA